MATLTIGTITRDGLDMAGAAAAAGGDEWANTGREEVHIKNGSGAPITVTFDIKTVVDGDLAVTDRQATINAGVTKAFGPFPKHLYNDPETGLAKVTYSSETSVTVKVVKLNR